MKEISYDEWRKQGKEKFGDDIKQWKFICPQCKTVQTAQDFIDAGVEKEDIEGYIAFSCIGRFTKEKGCDWTLGGLFQIHETEVKFDSGKNRPVFEFAY